MNFDIWLVGTLNQLLISGFYIHVVEKLCSL